MKWFNFGKEKRIKSSDPYMADFLGIRDTSSGQVITPESATSIPTIHACVQLIAESISSLPLPVYKRSKDGGRSVDKSHPLHKVLNEQANERQTSLEFREQIISSVLLTGNGYARKVINGRGQVIALEPEHPEHVFPERLKNGRIRYIVKREQGNDDIYLQDEMLHIKYRSKDGFTGLSPITIARQTIGISLAHQNHESTLFKNGARLAGVLKTNAFLKGSQKQELSRSWNEHYSGANANGKVVVLEEGMDYQPISLSQKDAEFIESRKMNNEDIARIFRVPPPSIGILDNATYSNITEQSRMLVKHCLMPWMVRIEKAMMMSLLTTAGRQTHFIEHNAEGLLRGNIKDRYEAYRIGIENGWLNSNEIRQFENFNNIGKDGDLYRKPMNSEPLNAQHITNEESA